jgi:hypothetical protein
MSPFSRPLALGDAQLDCIHRAAWPLSPTDPSNSLEAVVARLSACPEIGDGVVARTCVELQRRFWTPPDVGLPSKYARR